MSNYFNNIELENVGEDNPIKRDGVFNSLIVGSGSNAYRVDRQGLWLGSNSFSSAKFSVDMHGNLNSVGGVITGGTIQTGTSGARVRIQGNDIVIYDNTTGGTSPLIGDTASIMFTRTDAKNGNFFIQKRASANNDSGNVLEMFFNETASAGYNNIFIGRKGDMAAFPSQWKTDVFSLGTAGIVQMGVADRNDSATVSGFDIMTGVYFNSTIASPPTIPYSKEDAIQMFFTGARGNAATGDTGGITFKILESRGVASGKNIMVLDYDYGVAVEKITMYALNGATPSIELGGVAITSWNDVKTNLLSVSSNIISSSNESYNLGSSSYAWANLYVNQIYRGSSRKIEFGSTNIVMYAPINMNGYSFLNIDDLDVNGDCDIEGFVDINQYCSIHGVLYMNNQQVRDVADPTSAQHAATKAWVEANFQPKP